MMKNRGIISVLVALIMISSVITGIPGTAQVYAGNDTELETEISLSETEEPEAGVNVLEKEELEAEINLSETEELEAEINFSETEELEAGVAGSTNYAICFTYGDLKFEFPNKSVVPLSRILTALGLSGEVTAVSVSSDDLIASQDESTGKWTITMRQVLQNAEWIQVTIADVTYKIDVTYKANYLPPITYLDENGTTKTVTDYAVFERSDYAASVSCSATAEDGTAWTVLTEDVVIEGYANIMMNTHLILCDGASLTVLKGIDITVGASLTIYAQSEGANMGTIYAAGDGSYSAAIGGKGDIIINGGRIYAAQKGEAAGIGAAYEVANEYIIDITINGGDIIVAPAPAKISAFFLPEFFDDLMTAGYSVGATSGGRGFGAAIGSPQDRGAGTITVNGGSITIFDCAEETISQAALYTNGPGIGAGYGGSGGTINFNGGTYKCISETYSNYAIGGDNVSFNYNGGNVSTTREILSYPVNLSWTKETDSIEAALIGATVNILKPFKDEEGRIYPANTTYPCISNVKLTPYTGPLLFYNTSSLTKCFGDEAFTNNLTYVGDGVVTYKSSDPAVASVDASTGLVTIHKIGTVTITATSSKTDSYSAESTSYTLTVTPKTVTPSVTLSENRFVYDGKEKTPGVTVKDGDTVIPESEYTVRYVSNTGIGMAYVHVMDAEGGNYTINETSASFTIVDLSKPAFIGHNLLLSSEIGVMFKVTFPDDMDESHSFMTFEYSDFRGQVSQPIYEAEKVGDKTYWFTCYINPLELADKITATLDYEETTLVNEFSAMDYINYVNENWGERADKTKLLTLVNALQNFGSYMQNSGWKDDREHEGIAATKTLSETDVTAAAEGVKDMGIVMVNLAAAGISDTTFSLTLNSDTVINLCVKPDEEVTINSSSPSTYETDTETGKLKFVSNKIGAANLDKFYTFKIVTNLGTATVKASAMSYVNAVLSGGSTFTDAQKKAMTAYYNYHAAAENYQKE